MNDGRWQAENLTQALSSLNPTWYAQQDFISAQKIATDTRHIVAGDIFLALKGDYYDGHDYVEQAKQKGAVLAIVSRYVDSAIPQLVVTDTRLALGCLGKFHRNNHANVKIIAITGSSGKTTVKEMLGAIFSQLAPTLITRGNLNNDLGVPMMLLELTKAHRYAIIELGANHVGEIAYSTSLVSPDVACVLNVGTAHMGEFGGRANIAKAKAEIFLGLSSDGVAVLPFGENFFLQLYDAAQAQTHHILSFGERQVALNEASLDEASMRQMMLAQMQMVMLMGDVFADDVVIDGAHSQFSLNANLVAGEVDSVPVELKFAGEHNVMNALAAATCAMALGVSLAQIATGLSQALPAKGRLNFKALGRHVVIDDSYNANPMAVLKALDVLNHQAGKTLLVLGDIGELGDDAIGEHIKLGKDIAVMGVDLLFAVGELMAYTVESACQNGVQARHFADKSALKEAIVAQINDSDERWVVLLKGSRFMAMETIIDELCCG